MIQETIAKIEEALKTAAGIEEESTHLEAALVNLTHARELLVTHAQNAAKAAQAAAAPAAEPKAAQ